MAYDKVVDSTVLENGLSSIANAIRGKSGASDTLSFPAGFVGAISGLSTSGIKATTGTLTLADDTKQYTLNHGLGEVPVLFALSLRTDVNTLTEKSNMVIGGFGYSGSRGMQYFMYTNPAYYNRAWNSFGQGIEYAWFSGTTACFCAATADSIMLAGENTYKLVGGATYDWIAVGSGVFSA